MKHAHGVMDGLRQVRQETRQHVEKGPKVGLILSCQRQAVGLSPVVTAS